MNPGEGILFRLLIDTCVWLDLAKDVQQQPLLDALEQLIRRGEMSLIIPRTIIDEFQRNKIRAIEDSNRSLSGTLKRVKDAIERLGDPKEKRRVLRHLNEVDHRLPSLGDTAIGSVRRIENLFKASNVIEIIDEIKLKAAQRAIDRKAPFHRAKNSIDDAILFEIYASIVGKNAEPRTRYAFVTHNTKDFSLPNGDSRLPHTDFAHAFSRIRSRYFIRLGEALKCVAPDLLADIVFEHEWVEEPRSFNEIANVIEDLILKVWHDRHQMRRSMIEEGRLKVVDKASYSIDDPEHPIRSDIWAGALKAAAKVERQFGKDNLGPYTDFEWGMLNGKLSALRWALGDEWDNLDT